MALAGRKIVARSKTVPLTDLEVAAFEPPTAAAPGNVIIRVSRTSAGYPDLMLIRNAMLPPGYGSVTHPLTPGWELVGTVTAVGAGVQAFAVGDVVAALPCHGCMTTHIELPASSLFPVPKSADKSAAVCLVMTGVTAYQMLHRVARAQLSTPATASILVHGCTGGTGAMVVALARLMGVGCIIGTCAARNLDAARAAGVTAAIDYAADGGDFAAAVRAASPGGRGVDVVFDHITINGNLARDVAALVPRGLVVSYGFTDRTSPGRASVPTIMRVFLQLKLRHWLWSLFDGKDATFFGASSLGAAQPAFAADLAAVLALVASGALKPTADGGREWALADAPRALAAIEANAHRGKQIIVCD